VHVWMHKFFLSFWFCSLLFFKRMHLWVNKTWFFLFYYFWRMHIWMHEIWFSFLLLFLKNAYMNAWNLIFFWIMYVKIMIFYFFLLFWMKMHVWMHEILFLIFLDEYVYINAWNSIFILKFSFISNANVSAIFSMILQMIFFFSEFFKDNVSKRYVQIFQKKKYVQNIFSMIFKCFKIWVQRNFFNYFFIQKSMYNFMYFQKDFSMIFFQMHMYKEFKRSQEYVQTSKWKYVQGFLFSLFQNFIG